MICQSETCSFDFDYVSKIYKSVILELADQTIFASTFATKLHLLVAFNETFNSSKIIIIHKSVIS